MFAIPYVIIFAFHTELDIDRVVIERSVGHLREKLTSLDYLTCEQLEFKDRTTLLQLRDCALAVASKSKKNTFFRNFFCRAKVRCQLFA